MSRHRLRRAARALSQYGRMDACGTHLRSRVVDGRFDYDDGCFGSALPGDLAGSPTNFARMGRICLRGLADPGAFLTLLAGIILVATNRAHYLHARWLHIKLVFVAVLIGVHGIAAISNKPWYRDQRTFRVAMQSFCLG